MTAPERVRQLSEEQLLARILPHYPPVPSTLVGPGDDAAVVAAPDGRFVVSTDVLVEDRHFRREWSTGYDVGWRAAAQNLADCAAMGARATSLVVSLVVPGDVEVEWVVGLARGLAAACAEHGAAVVGGDLSGGAAVVVAVTVHGDLEGRPPVLRSGAMPGHVVAHCGVLGRSAAGLALLGAGRRDVAEELVVAFLRPEPPVAAGAAAATAGASAMLDVSDGLLRDAGRIARSSGVAIDLDHVDAALAVDVAAVSAAARALGADPALWVLSGGEDHGLLATFPPDVGLPEGFRVIGRVLGAESAPGRVTLAGEPVLTSAGWDHFGG